MLLIVFFSLFVVLKSCVEYVRAEYDNVAAVIVNSMLEGIRWTESTGNFFFSYF